MTAITSVISVIAENANRDMFLDPATGDLAIYTGAQAVGQLAKCRIEAQRNEMVYAADSGMPMMETAFNNFNPAQFEAAARLIILDTPGVTAIESFSMYSNNNVLNYAAVIETICGSTTITGAAAT